MILSLYASFRALRIVFSVICFLILGSVSVWGGASPAEIEQWLDLHNQFRVKHQVEPVIWSQTVAASAQAYADSCPVSHSGSGYGENMGWGYQSISSVVTSWYSEEDKYDYSNPGFSMTTGHFTQVVWKGTTEIGCALKTGCSNWSRTWVCQYNPPGNYLERFAQNVFPPVTNPPPPVTPPPVTPPPTKPVSGLGKSIAPVIQLLLK